MKRIHTLFLLIAAAALAAATPARAANASAPGHWGEDNAFRLHGGLFTPDGNSRYWDDKALDFTGGADDFEDFTLSVDYLRYLRPRLGLLLSAGFWEGENRARYRDFVDDRGLDIVHDTALETVNLTVGLVTPLAGRDAPIVPYVGAGAGLWVYRLDEIGDFIVFGPPGPDEIFFGDFQTEGTTFGYYLQAGFEVPIGYDTTLFAEGRWTRADDDLADDFEGLGEIDLGGRALSLGISWRF